MAFGQAVRAARVAQAIAQDEFAALAGISRGSVALPVDKRVWGRNGCQFFKRDGFVLTIHKTGRQKTA